MGVMGQKRVGHDVRAMERSLRMWQLKHHKGWMPFFDEWRWLEKGIREGDINLRKRCIQAGSLGLFGSPQEMLDWIKDGIIPPCCQEASNGAHHKTEL